MRYNHRMTLVRPRLSDYHKIPLSQAKVDFAIPFIDEDIPLYLDPFLLWKSPAQQDNALHADIVNAFNYLGILYKSDKAAAISVLKELSECEEVGLGTSKTRKGTKVGDKLATEILNTFLSIPQLNEHGYRHFEQAQLIVEGLSKDRISDIASNLIKSWLIDYTIQKCREHGIPRERVPLKYYDTKNKAFAEEEVDVPVNPETGQALLLVPKRWLRFSPWLNPDDYFSNYIAVSNKLMNGERIGRQEVLEYNRKNFDSVLDYTEIKQREATDCKSDPLFTQIPTLSTKRKLSDIIKLPTGKDGGADKDYEEKLTQLLASVLYPELDFAKPQSRTVSGVLIRDLIFYNNVEHPFLKDLYDKYNSRQIVIEMKNVLEVETKHINQLNRYMKDDFGKFGIIFTRNSPPKKIVANTIDLWAGQRRCILILTDEDLRLMCQLYESKQRQPIDVIKKKYKEFMDMCPS